MLGASQYPFPDTTDFSALLLQAQESGAKVLGLANIARDVTPELARATIASITVLGALHASAEVRTALSDRMG